MAEPQERDKAFRDSALVLVDDAIVMAAKLRKLLRSSEYQRLERVAEGLRETARDLKFIVRRLPRKD